VAERLYAQRIQSTKNIVKTKEINNQQEKTKELNVADQ
jgi:hypothetical protein